MTSNQPLENEQKVKIRQYFNTPKIIEILIVIAFQIAFGVIITSYINSRISTIQNKLNIDLREKDKMESISSQYNSLSHTRLFLMNRLINCYKSQNNLQDKEKFRNEYLDSVNSWNSNRGFLESNIELHFGKEELNLYQETVDKSFREIHQKIDETIKKTQDNKQSADARTIELKSLEADIIKLTRSIYELDKIMQAKIRSVVSKPES